MMYKGACLSQRRVNLGFKMCATGEINTQMSMLRVRYVCPQKSTGLCLWHLRMRLEKETSVAVIVKHLMSVAIAPPCPLSPWKQKWKQLPYLLVFVMCWSHTAAHAFVGRQGIPVWKTACLWAKSLYFWKVCGPIPVVPRVRSWQFSWGQWGCVGLARKRTVLGRSRVQTVWTSCTIYTTAS